jgi:hypothetical protein
MVLKRARDQLAFTHKSNRCGVPVVTLPGTRLPSRVSASFMSRIDPRLIASNLLEYRPPPLIRKQNLRIKHHAAQVRRYRCQPRNKEVAAAKCKRSCEQGCERHELVSYPGLGQELGEGEYDDVGGQRWWHVFLARKCASS